LPVRVICAWERAVKVRGSPPAAEVGSAPTTLAMATGGLAELLYVLGPLQPTKTQAANSAASLFIA
jgi:hypothetical protein